MKNNYLPEEVKLSTDEILRSGRWVMNCKNRITDCDLIPAGNYDPVFEIRYWVGLGYKSVVGYISEQNICLHKNCYDALEPITEFEYSI